MRFILVILQDNEGEIYLFRCLFVFSVSYLLPERICSEWENPEKWDSFNLDQRVFRTCLQGCQVVPVRGLTCGFSFSKSRMTLAMVINFPIFLPLDPTVTPLGHQFLILRYPSDNSCPEERDGLPFSVSGHTAWRPWQETHTSSSHQPGSMRNFIPATLLVSGLETRDMGGVSCKT